MTSKWLPITRKPLAPYGRNLTPGRYEAERFELMVRSGLRVVEAVLEEERTTLCGPRYAHQPARAATRAGTVPSEMVLGGRKVAVARPRVRAAGREVPLPTFQTLAREDPLNRRVVEQMLVGVATRQYARSLEPVPAGVVSRGTSKSRACRSLGRKSAHAGSTGTTYRSSTFKLLTNGSNPVGCPAGRRSAVRFAVAQRCSCTAAEDY